MRSSFILLAVLILGSFMAGCTAKEPGAEVAPATTEPPVTDEAAEDMPVVEEVSEEELPQEPDFELDETVDLGSLL